MGGVTHASIDVVDDDGSCLLAIPVEVSADRILSTETRSVSLAQENGLQSIVCLPEAGYVPVLTKTGILDVFGNEVQSPAIVVESSCKGDGSCIIELSTDSTTEGQLPSTICFEFEDSNSGIKQVVKVVCVN